MTSAFVWWLAGGDAGEEKAGGKLAKVSAATGAEIKSLGKGVPALGTLAADLAALPEIHLGPYQERLLKEATLLEKRRVEARGSEPARELRLWRTGFKYPLIREEVTLRRDEQGRELPVRRDFSVADHAMVKFPDDFTEMQIAEWARRHGFYVRHRLQTTAVRLVAIANATLSSADMIMAAFRQAFPNAGADATTTAERDYLVFPALLPDDTSFSQLWGMHNTGQNGGTVDADIDAPEAWEISTGSREVLVGVIDTGVDRTHPDLVANMWSNPHEVASNGVDDDGNGFVDDVNGWDFFSNDNNPMDEDDHGTHCSGTIGGVGNNHSGVAGVCWQVSIVGIRFLGPSGGATSDAIECVNYATGLGVDLTSNSWGGGGNSALLQAAIAAAGAANQLFIAAAGNDGSNTDISPQYPAGYPVDSIISVASSTDRDVRSSFSNYGSNSVDLAAPGSSIYSTILGGGYANFSGTSMATPHVSGAVALLKSIVPNMTAAEIKAQLMATVDPLSAFTTTTVSGGRLNAARLIEAVAGPRPVITVTTISEEPGGNGDGIRNPGETLALHFTVVNRGSDAAQNVTASLASDAANSRFTITQGNVSVGTLTPGQSVVVPTAFRVRSQATTPTPYAEEFIISLSHGSPLQVSTHRVTLYLHTSSQITGRVTMAGDGAALAGATIRLVGPSTVTTTSGSDGSYTATVIDGTYSITAAAAGYVTSAPVSVVAPPGQSGVNFALGIPQLGLTPPVLDAGMFTRRPITRTVEMRNRGTAELTWSLKTVNGLPDVAGTMRKLFTLQAREVVEHQTGRDVDLRTAFKSMQMREARAVEAPLGVLDGMTIGAVSTDWDRTTLTRDLEGRGAVVVTLTLPLSVAALDAVDAVIVDDEISLFSSTDISRLRTRISAGAGLLCEGDNSSSIARINELFASTGITAVYDGFRDLTFTDIRAHPMTVGVTSLREVAVGASATLSGAAEMLVADPNGRSHAAVSVLGQGTVVFVGNEISDDSNYISGDARLFANQIVDGIIGGPSWMKVRMTSGVIPPGGAQMLTVEFGSVSLSSGEYLATMVFTTNVPDEPELRLPVTLKVTDAPLMELNQTAIVFGSVVEGVMANKILSISNRGTQPLNVSSLTLRGKNAASFSINGAASFQVPAGAARPVTFDFSTAAALGDHSAEVVVAGDDPSSPSVVVPITGTRQLPPDIAVTPASLLLQLRQGEVGVLNATLENKGNGPLDWRAALGHEPGKTGVAPTWAALTGISGRANPKTKGQIRINLDTGLLPPGDHTTMLYVASQDVDTPLITRPVTLRVLAAPRPSHVIAHTFVDTIVGTRRQITVPVRNLGAANLVLGSALSLAPSFVCLTKLPLTIPGNETRDLTIEFRPSRVAAVAGSMVFGANVPGKYLYLTLNGRGIRGPTLQANPTSITLSTRPGHSVQRPLTITNTGGLPLTWSADKEDLSGIFSLGSSGGTLNAGQSTVVILSFSTANLPPATYRGRIILNSNDTARPRVLVPVNVTVSRAGNLVLTPESVRFDEAWAGRAEASFFECENLGNIPVQVQSMTASSTQLSHAARLPLNIEPGIKVRIPFQFRADVPGEVQSRWTLTVSPKMPIALVLPVTAKVVAPPTLAVIPGSLSETLTPGELVSRDLSVTNSGGSRLDWSVSLRDNLGPASDLESVLSNFNTKPGALTALLSNAHPLTEGVTGSSITDGGGNMFDSGNIHSTDLQGGIALAYSDNAVINTAAVGAGGRYFTRVSGPLFLFAADLVGASRFKIDGGLGADGQGSMAGSTFTRTVAGVTYRGYFKSVSGTASPSVNHLIILEEKSGIAQILPSTTDSDLHEITGLSGNTRIYHLLFGLRNGVAVPETTASLMMDAFLRQMVHATSVVWLTPDQALGSSAPGSSTSHTMQLDARTLPGGSYGAVLRFSSNALINSQLDVPVSMQVPSLARLVPEFSALGFPDTFLRASNTLACKLSNPGNLPLTITRIESNDAAFTFSGLTLPVTLQPRTNASITVRFAPTEVRTHSASLTLFSDATGVPEKVISLSGKGLRGPEIGVTPTPVSITVTPGATSSQILTVANTGDASLTWNVSRSASLTSLTSLSAVAGTAPVGGSSPLSLNVITSANTAPATVTGMLTFTSNDTAQPSLSVPVSIIILARPRLGLSPPTSLSFGNVFLNTTGQQPLTLRNDGNSTLSITGISSSDSHFNRLPVALPITLSPASSMQITVTFLPDVAGPYSDELSFTTNDPLVAVTRLPINGSGLVPPTIQVQPGGISASLERGLSHTQAVTVSNDGGSTLTWQAAIINGSTSTGTLQDVLQRFNNQFTSITNLVPFLYSFTEGVTGNFISDGGNDMYDNGNYLNSSLGGFLPYSDNVVINSNSLGVGGRYFTRKQPGLFIFVGDMNAATSFSITGNLGADGAGSTSGAVLTRTVGGVTYKGFFKGVYGTTDPSVNHLIIVEDKPSISHTYSTNTDLDSHTISGLSGTTRLYYLLFARQNGAQVSDALAGSIMDAFLQNIAQPAGFAWADVSPASGSTSSAGSSATTLTFDSRSLPVGTHTATLRFTSNAPLSGTVDVPLSLEVTPTQYEVAPAAVSALQLLGAAATTSSLSLTAMTGGSPAWTASATVPWITLSKNSGTGSDMLSLTYSNTLTAGSYSGAVTVSYGSSVITIPVTLSVRETAYTQLITDYRMPRLLGIIRGMGTQSSLLVAVNAGTLAVENVLPLPADITDADLTTDGRLLYAISFSGRSISQVNLESFTLVSTKTIPTPLDAGTGSPYHYHIEAGRPGIVYYVDAATAPRLHVFDYNAGVDLSTFVLNSSVGFGDFTITPDGNTIYAWSQSGWTTSGSSSLARINCASNTLSQTSLSTDLVSQSPLDAPVFYGVNRDMLFTKDSRFVAALTSRQSFTGQHIIAASAYGQAVASNSAVLDGSSGASLQTLPVNVSTAAFTGDQSALVYLDSTTQQLVRLVVPGLTPAFIAPSIPDGGLISSIPASLAWSGSPLSASYDVFLGTDFSAVNGATNSSPGIFRANTSGVSLSFSAGTFVNGQTYYWRIDTRNFDGTTIKGPVWSFRIPPVLANPASLSLVAPLNSSSFQALLSLTAGASTPWTLSENETWLSLDTISGSGPAVIALNLLPSGMSSGTHTSQLTLTSGTDSISIPISLRIFDTLNITKLEADPVLQKVYALHRENTAPFECFLIWIDPATALPEGSVSLGNDATDFTVHAADDRIYALTQGGTRVLGLQRQQTRQIVTNWSTASPQLAIHSGPVGRVVLKSTGNLLQMCNSGTGGAVGGAIGGGISAVVNPTRNSADGSLIFVASQVTSTQMRVARYLLISSGIVFTSSYQWTGTLTPQFTVSADGSRAFIDRRLLSLGSTISLITTLPTDVYAASFDGQMAFSMNKSHEASASFTELATLPFTTTLLAATVNHARLVMYDPVVRSLSSIDPGALVVAPSTLNFGQVLLTTPTTQQIMVKNLSSHDVTLTINSTHPAFTGPTTAVTINANQFALVPIRCAPTAVGQISSTLTFAAVGHPQLSRTMQASAQGVTALSSSSLISAEASSDIFDLDGDSVLDLWINGNGPSVRSVKLITHSFTYTRRVGIPNRAVSLLASRDGMTWTSLTPGLDYQIESITPAREECETVKLSIPTDAESAWQFRLMGTP